MLFDETVEHLLASRLVELDGELVALDANDLAVPELEMEHPFAKIEGRRDIGDGFRHQFALDCARSALSAPLGAAHPPGEPAA